MSCVRDREFKFRWRTGVLAVTALAAAALTGAGTGAAASSGSSAPPAGYTVTRVLPITFAQAVAVDSANGSVYVLSRPVVVLNASTGQVTATVAVPAGGTVVAADATTNRVYFAGAASPGSFSLTVLDGTTNSVLTSIALPADPGSIAVDPVTDTIYVLDGSGLVVVNGATDTVTGTIAIAGQPRAVAVDPATDKIYVTERGAVAVAVVDGSTGTVSATIKLSDVPEGIAVNPVTNTIYTANQFRTVSVINGATNKVADSIDLSREQVIGMAIAVDPVRNTVVVTNNHGWAGYSAIINGATRKVTGSFTRGGFSVAIDPASGDIYQAFSSPWGIWRLIPGTVNQTCPILLTSSGLIFDVGVHESATLFADAEPAPTITETGALPAGLSLSQAGVVTGPAPSPAGVITGTPAPGTAGVYQIQATLSNGVAPSTTRPVFINVGPAPAITSPDHVTFVSGASGYFTVQATGRPEVSVYETGALPAGVNFNGALSGTPAAGTGGIYKITFTAADSVTSTTQAFTLTVDEAPSFTSPDRVTFRARRNNTFTVRTRGFPAAHITEKGALPRGVSFRPKDNGTATLTGKPWRITRHRRFVLVLTARNGAGMSTRQVLTLSIS